MNHPSVFNVSGNLNSFFLKFGQAPQSEMAIISTKLIKMDKFSEKGSKWDVFPGKGGELPIFLEIRENVTQINRAGLDIKKW